MLADNFKNLAETNSNFRKVLYTGKHAQVVAMCLAVDEEIGEEVHQSTDQVFLIAAGEAEAMVGGDVWMVEKHSLVFVPAGTNHNITNTGESDLKLLTIYSPPAHSSGTIHATKKDAVASETETPEQPPKKSKSLHFSGSR